MLIYLCQNLIKHIFFYEGNDLSLGLKFREVSSSTSNESATAANTTVAVQKEKSVPKEITTDVATDVATVAVIDCKERNSLDSISSISDSSINEMPIRKPRHRAGKNARRIRESKERKAKLIGTIDLRSMSRSLSPPEVPDLMYENNHKFLDFTSSNIYIIFLFFRPSKSPECQKLPTPKELEQQSAEIENERYMWEKFR